MVSGWIKWNGDIVKEKVVEANLKAVNFTANKVLAAAKSEAPLDEGTLSASGMVVTRKLKSPVAAVCFGGGRGTGLPRIPYAIRWHETQANFQHGRKWKYLKDPYNRLASSTFTEAIKREMNNL